MIKAILAAPAAASPRAVGDQSWRVTIAKHEAALCRYYASFPWRSIAVMHAVKEIAAKPRRQGPMRRLNDGWEYELRRFPFDVFRNGTRDAGV